MSSAVHCRIDPYRGVGVGWGEGVCGALQVGRREKVRGTVRGKWGRRKGEKYERAEEGYY